MVVALLRLPGIWICLAQRGLQKDIGGNSKFWALIFAFFVTTKQIT